MPRRYLENVPTIVPVLEKEHRNASARLTAVRDELSNLHPDRLREKGRKFREAFLDKLQLLIKGTVSAPPERFGETLADEHVRGGTFVGPNGKPLVVAEGLPNAHMRLFGGAQYHRAMAEVSGTGGTGSQGTLGASRVVEASVACRCSRLRSSAWRWAA